MYTLKKENGRETILKYLPKHSPNEVLHPGELHKYRCNPSSKPCDVTKKNSVLIGLCNMTITSGYILIWPKNLIDGTGLHKKQAERSGIFSE